MNKDAQALAQYFEEHWQPMLAQMSRARAIEFKIRLAAEVHAQASFSQSRTWEEFQKGQRKVVRMKLEKHISAVFPHSAERMILVRQCADGLAHADYRAARMRIDQYGQRFGLIARLSNAPVGLMVYRNVTHHDGTRSDVGYFLTSSDENLILEEHEVFERQGYAVAAEEMLSFADQQLVEVAPRLNLRYAALVFSRGLKYGQRLEMANPSLQPTAFGRG